MTHNPAPVWYNRHQNGETFTQIAKSARVTRSRVSGAIQRYREDLENPKPAKAKQARSMPVLQKQPSAPKRHAVDPEALARFDKASAARSCLWMDGDLRDGTIEVCGMRRARGAYCTEHGERAYRGSAAS